MQKFGMEKMSSTAEKVVIVDAMRSFHCRIRHSWEVEVNARLNLFAFDHAVSRCSAGTYCSFTVCVLALDFTSSPVPS